MLSVGSNQELTDELYAAIIRRIPPQDLRLRELLECLSFFAYRMGCGANDEQAAADEPSWLQQSIELLGDLK